MSNEQEILMDLKALNRKFDAFAKLMKAPEWLSEEEAMALTGLSKKSLQLKRKSGDVKYRFLRSGRGFQYRKDTLNDLFIEA